MHFFVTGHTGFKGSWLTLYLSELGHEVSGYALGPPNGGLFEKARLRDSLTRHFEDDIRDVEKLRAALNECKPDFAIHMAAQPLVLKSYKDPLETYTTNVDGTRNFLQAISALDKPPVSLVVTTDKVYRDDSNGPYVESDPLGGHDPYAASKAMADILTHSWSLTNPALKIHIARAGNVIGAFDVSENRLLPDVVSSVSQGKALEIRNPSAVRPWQHVLDCLSGYIALLEASAAGRELPVALNFGPDASNIRTVREVLDVAKIYQPTLKVKAANTRLQPKETLQLTLDSSKAKSLLNWENRINFDLAVKMSVAELDSESPRDLALDQIRAFSKLRARD